MQAHETGPIGRSLAATQLIVGPRPTTPIVFCDNTIWDGSPKHCTPALHCLGRNSARNEGLDRLMSIAGVGAYTVGATILCALTTTASNVHAMMGMVNEALWTEPNGRTVGCIHETAHPRAGDDPRCPEGMSLWKETWRPHRSGRAAPLQRKGIDDNSSRGTSRPAGSRRKSAGHYPMDEAQPAAGRFVRGVHRRPPMDPHRSAARRSRPFQRHCGTQLPDIIAHTDVHFGGAANSRTHHAIYLRAGQGELLCGGASRLIGASHGVGDRRAAEDIWCRIGVRPEL